MPPKPVVLDTDIGTDVDDALALVLAARSPELSLLSVTTVGGRPRVRALIASRLLALIGREEVPVAAGLARALPSRRFDPFLPDGLWMGHEGEGLLGPDERESPGDGDGDGVAALAGSVRAAASASVVAIGPCTNVASALAGDPGLGRDVAEVVAMGGVVRRPSGRAALSPYAEFNFNADREAAAALLAADVPMTLVPAEVTTQSFLTQADVEDLRSSGDPGAVALAGLLDVWAPVFQRVVGAVLGPEVIAEDWVCQLHDPMTVLTMTSPHLFAFEDVRIGFGEEDGAFVTTESDDGRPVRLVVDADFAAVRREVVSRLVGEEAA